MPSSRAAACSSRPRAVRNWATRPYLILTLMDDPNKLAITGKVVLADPRGVPAGSGASASSSRVTIPANWPATRSRR
ncbi:MAG: hypothetical protein R3E68_14300 [Burkholderiaceae bacterium]